MSKLSWFLIVVILSVLGLAFALRNFGLIALYIGMIIGGIVGIQGERNRK